MLIRAILYTCLVVTVLPTSTGFTFNWVSNFIYTCRFLLYCYICTSTYVLRCWFTGSSCCSVFSVLNKPTFFFLVRFSLVDYLFLPLLLLTLFYFFSSCYTILANCPLYFIIIHSIIKFQIRRGESNITFDH